MLLCSPTNSAIIVGLGGGAVSALFTTPPTPIPVAGPGMVANILNIDFDRDGTKVSGTSGEYSQSALEFMKANSTDLHKVKLVSHRAFGFRTITHYMAAIYHVCADLPFPDFSEARGHA